MFEDVAFLDDVATVKLRHCHGFRAVLAALKLEDALEHRVAAGPTGTVSEAPMGPV